MKISVVMALRDRVKQLRRTLHSIALSAHKDVEVIIVDDASREEERVESVVAQFPFARLIRVEPSQRWWFDPCVPYNIGFAEARGEITVIQNPECLHVGDVLSYVAQNLAKYEYAAFGMYSIDQALTDKLDQVDWSTSAAFEQVKSIISPMNNACFTYDGQNSWYIHPQYRPDYLHFLAAIYTRHLKEMGGFDERYADGIAFDDNELQVRLVRMGMPRRIQLEPFGIHQWHFAYGRPEGWAQRFEHNKYLFEQVTLRENRWRVENPRFK